MRFFFCFLCSVSIMLSATPGYSGIFSRNKAKLSEPAMSDSIDPETHAPLIVKKHFSPDTGTLYATIKLSDAPKKTEVKAVFFLSSESEQQIAKDAMVTNGTGYLSFELNPPASGWPQGDYKVLFFLNGEETEHLVFTVNNQPIEGKKPIVTTGSTNETSSKKGNDSPYKAFQDKKFGFSFELPKSWDFQIAPVSRDYVFTGPENTNESEITIIVQIIDTRMGEMTDIKTQMLDMVDQISRAPQADIVKKDQTPVAGQVAPFFIATYQANDKTKQKVKFGHTQLGLKHDPYFFLVSYAAPRQIYQEQLGIFQHMMDTFKLSPPEQ